MAYGSGPYAHPSDPDAGTTPAPLVSSRRLDPSREQGSVYVLGANGAYEGMDDVAQRVLLLIAYRAGARPKVLDDRSLAARRDAIRAALAPLTAGPSPTIEIVTITVERVAPGRARELVEFRKLLTNTRTTVEAR